MTLRDGLTDIASGKIATIVTSLEMLKVPALNEIQPQKSWHLEQIQYPDIDWYLTLYRRVGENWLWFSRLLMEKTKVQTIISHPDVEIYTLQAEGEESGLLELDFREHNTCELAFLGIVPELFGVGAGRYLLNHAIKMAWNKGIERVWVHTCTLDHPNSVEFYMKSGFKPFRRQVEVLDDPRFNGVISKSSAPHIPII